MGKIDAKPDPKETVGIIDALSKLGFTEAQFRPLHHLGDSLAGFRSYCPSVQSFVAGGSNHRLAIELKRKLDPNLPNVPGR
jgi:hypothetical protein